MVTRFYSSDTGDEFGGGIAFYSKEKYLVVDQDGEFQERSNRELNLRKVHKDVYFLEGINYSRDKFQPVFLLSEDKHKGELSLVQLYHESLSSDGMMFEEY